MIEYIFRVKGCDIFYTPETNGGGDHFFVEYLDLIIQQYGRVHHILEWCSAKSYFGVVDLGVIYLQSARKYGITCI